MNSEELTSDSASGKYRSLLRLDSGGMAEVSKTSNPWGERRITSGGFARSSASIVSR